MANSNESKFLVCQELSDFFITRGQKGKFTKLLLDQGRKTKEKRKKSFFLKNQNNSEPVLYLKNQNK